MCFFHIPEIHSINRKKSIYEGDFTLAYALFLSNLALLVIGVTEWLFDI